MKNKTPKARVMWVNYYPKFVGAPSIYPDRERAEQAAAGHGVCGARYCAGEVLA